MSGHLSSPRHSISSIPQSIDDGAKLGAQNLLKGQVLKVKPAGTIKILPTEPQQYLISNLKAHEELRKIEREIENI